MQIVIDIPDTVWNKAMEYGHLDICGIELSEKVMNGTPLPKGHGRIIDECDIRVIELEDSLHIIRHEKGDEVDVYIDAPTIIEADKTESEDDE